MNLRRLCIWAEHIYAHPLLRLAAMMGGGIIATATAVGAFYPQAIVIVEKPPPATPMQPPQLVAPEPSARADPKSTREAEKQDVPVLPSTIGDDDTASMPKAGGAQPSATEAEEKIELAEEEECKNDPLCFSNW